MIFVVFAFFGGLLFSGVGRGSLLDKASSKSEALAASAALAGFVPAAPTTLACCMVEIDSAAASEGRGPSGAAKHLLTLCSNMLVESSSDSESMLT